MITDTPTVFPNGYTARASPRVTSYGATLSVPGRLRDLSAATYVAAGNLSLIPPPLIYAKSVPYFFRIASAVKFPIAASPAL